MQAQGGEHRPAARETQLPFASNKHHAHCPQNGASQQVSIDFQLVFLLHNMLKDITPAPASSAALTRKVLLVFILSHSPQHHQPKSAASNSPGTLQPSLFRVTCYKTLKLQQLMKLHQNLEKIHLGLLTKQGGCSCPSSALPARTNPVWEGRCRAPAEPEGLYAA